MNVQEETGLVRERLRVHALLLADHAVIAENKLYVNGGGFDAVFMRALPGPLPAMTVVVRLGVPYGLTGESHVLSLRLLDADRRPVQADPLISVTAETGRPPGLRPGDEVPLMIAAALAPGIVVQEAETLYVHLEAGGETLDVIPLRILLQPAVPEAPGALPPGSPTQQ